MNPTTTRRHRRTAAALGICALGAAVLAPQAAFGSPPPSWTNERLLTCDGQQVRTYLTPAGFGTPFHVVGSPDVIVPKHVEVVFAPGTEPVVTVHVPGFDPHGPRVTHCGYVDPEGLVVTFSGLRS